MSPIEIPRLPISLNFWRDSSCGRCKSVKNHDKRSTIKKIIIASINKSQLPWKFFRFINNNLRLMWFDVFVSNRVRSWKCWRIFTVSFIQLYIQVHHRSIKPRIMIKCINWRCRWLTSETSSEKEESEKIPLYYNLLLTQKWWLSHPSYASSCDLDSITFREPIVCIIYADNKSANHCWAAEVQWEIQRLRELIKCK